MKPADPPSSSEDALDERTEEPTATGDQGTPRVGREVLGWCLVICGAFAWGAWRHRWVNEDGFINFRVVENLLLGHGPVFNAGERVEAFTSPAQVAVLALGRVVTLGAVRIETLAFAIGIVAAAAAMWCAMVGAVRLWGPEVGPHPRWLPLGALTFVAVPATWDYATSGHEGAIAYLWLGASMLILSTRVDQLRRGIPVAIDRPRGALVLLGSGPLVRPEFALYSISFAICWWALDLDAPGSRIRAMAWASSLVVVGQVARMGYFGVLVPNTAIAKVGGLDVGRGVSFLVSFVRPYGLQIVIPVVVVVVAPLVVRASWAPRAVVLAFVVPSILVVVQLVAIGGDYMHGRLPVQPLFGLLAPVAMVPRAAVWDAEPGRGCARKGAALLLAAWALLAAVALRADPTVRGQDLLDPRLDSRELARSFTQSDATRTEDYRDDLLTAALTPHGLAQDRSASPVLWVEGSWADDVVPLPATQPSTIASTTVGALGMLAGPEVRIIDRTALADPVGARQPAVQDTPGHLRLLANPWVYARAGVAVDPASVAAKRALACGRLGELMDAVDEPLTPGRFVRNLLHAPRNTFVHVPADPTDAVDAFC